MAFIKSRKEPTIESEMVAYRSLDSLVRVEVYVHTDGKYFLMGCIPSDRGRPDRPGMPGMIGRNCVFFGPLEGYATMAEAEAALEAVLTPILT